MVLLDSGSSVAESVFLSRMRKWMFDALEERIREFRKPTVYITYPTEHCRPRHGAYPVGEYDKWEVRPIRWRRRPLNPKGILATMVDFEEGCHRKKIKAPWREWNSKNRRCALVYLHPNRQDLSYASRRWRDFKAARNVPDFFLGPPFTYGIPPSAIAWLDGIWSFSNEGHKRMTKAFGGGCFRIPWESWWAEDAESGKPKPRFGIAQPWGDMGTKRWPGLAVQWAQDAGGSMVRGRDDNSWQGFLPTTRAEFYMLATTRESVPWDAMIAVARGSTLVAPDTPMFRALPGRKILFPALAQGDQIVWSSSETRQWIKQRLQT